MKYFTSVDRGRDQEPLRRVYRFERSDGSLLVHVQDLLVADGEDTAEPHGEERTMRLDLAAVGDGSAFSLMLDGASHDVLVDRSRDGKVVVQCDGERVVVGIEDERERSAKAVAGAKGGGRREVRAAMPGVVVDVLVAEGDEVGPHDTLLVLEAMKMQNPVSAESAGTVEKLSVKKGQTVAGGDLLAVVS